MVPYHAERSCDKSPRLMPDFVRRFMLKLSARFQPDEICELLSQCGIAYVSLLDSMRGALSVLRPDKKSAPKQLLRRGLNLFCCKGGRRGGAGGCAQYGKFQPSL